MARLLVAALRAGGHAVTLPSALRSHAKTPEPATLAALEAASMSEVQRLLTHWAGEGAAEKPQVWFTYHLYYKAPDLVGPAVARALAIPYVVAEASHAGKRSKDGWAAWQAHAEAGLTQAAAVFCLTRVDREGLEQLGLAAEKLVDLPPFLDAKAPGPRVNVAAPPRLITIAMMRDGAKLESYRFLAQALALLADRGFAPAVHLDIIGDGPAQPGVEAAFAALPPGSVTFHGQLPCESIRDLLAAATLFVWPGFGEAFGLAYLEAQAAGVPVVALDCGGIASTLVPGITGLLVARPEPQAYAAAVASLLRNPGRCRTMATAAARFIGTERSLLRAAAILEAGIRKGLTQ